MFANEAPPPPEGAEYATDKYGQLILDSKGQPVLRKAATAGDQLTALAGQRDAAAYQGPESWAMRGASAGPMSIKNLIGADPNVYQNQHDAAREFARVNTAEQTLPANQRTDRIKVQGMNGEREYVQRADGSVVPATGSLDAISFTNAGGR